MRSVLLRSYYTVPVDRQRRTRPCGRVLRCLLYFQIWTGTIRFLPLSSRSRRSTKGKRSQSTQRGKSAWGNSVRAGSKNLAPSVSRSASASGCTNMGCPSRMLPYSNIRPLNFSDIFIFIVNTFIIKIF